MHDSFRVQVADSHSYLQSVKLHYRFWQAFVGLKNLVKFASTHKRHHEVKPGLSLEQIFHSDEEWVFTAEEDVLLKASVLHLLEIKKHILTNRLDCVLFA